MRPLFALSAIAALAIGAPVAAHHGWSSYNNEKTIRVTAPLTDVTWGNPHGTARVMWQKKKWDVILAPTTRMEARGLSQAMLTSRRPVTLIGYPRRDGATEMRIETVIAGGKTVELR